MQKQFIISAAVAAFVGTPAFAADMALKASPRAPDHTCVWCGWYVGLNAGYVNSSDDFNIGSTPVPDAVLGVVGGVSEGLAALSTGGIRAGNTGGFIGGAQAGYNWQFHNLVAGFEADIQGLSRSGSSGTTTNTGVVVGVPIISTQTASMSTSYLGTLRGRLGWAMTPSWLAYVTGGLAYGGVKATNTLFQSGTNGFIGAGSGTLSDTHAGWVLGGGLEWMLATKWGIKAEYLHYDLGRDNFNSAPASAFFATPIYQTNVLSARYQGDIIRAGINYHL